MLKIMLFILFRRAYDLSVHLCFAYVCSVFLRDKVRKRGRRTGKMTDKQTDRQTVAHKRKRTVTRSATHGNTHEQVSKPLLIE